MQEIDATLVIVNGFITSGCVKCRSNSHLFLTELLSLHTRFTLDFICLIVGVLPWSLINVLLEEAITGKILVDWTWCENYFGKYKQDIANSITS